MYNIGHTFTASFKLVFVQPRRERVSDCADYSVGIVWYNDGI
jgi:hypothetical protein